MEAAPAEPKVLAPGEPPRPAIGGVGGVQGARQPELSGPGKLKLDVCPKATPGWADAARGPCRRGWGERAGIYPERLGPPAGRSLVQDWGARRDGGGEAGTVPTFLMGF